MILNSFVLLLPTTSLSLLSLSTLFLTFILLVPKKYSYSSLILTNIFMILLIFGFLKSYNESVFKYLTVASLFFLFFKVYDNQKQSNEIKIKHDTLNFLIFCSLLNLIFVILEILKIYHFHEFFRASSLEIHKSRSSGLFLYPGDLGAYAALNIIIGFYFYKLNFQKVSIFVSPGLLIFLNSFFLMLSQSRMGLVTLFIGLAILFCTSIRGLLFLGIVIFCITTIFLSNSPILPYLFDASIFERMNNVETLTTFKRLAELYLMYNSILGADVDSHEFYESSVVSLYFKVGLLLPLIIYFIVPTVVVVKSIWSKSFQSLCIFLPVVMTSFISAPTDRPKLQIFTIMLVCFSLIIKPKKTAELLN